MAREHLDEMRTRHTGLVDAELHDLAFMAAHFIHHIAHGAAQRFNLLGGETECGEFIQDAVVQLDVFLVLRAPGLQDHGHFFVRLTNHGKTRQHFRLQFCQRSRRDGSSLCAVIILVFALVLFGFF